MLAQQTRAFLPEEPDFRSNKDVAVFRWWTKNLNITAEQQDRGIEDWVNRWLEENRDRKLKGISINYSWDFHEGAKEHSGPRWYVTILSEKIKDKKDYYPEGARGLQIVRSQFSPDTESFVQDRLVEQDLNKWIEDDRNRDKLVKKVTYQNDYGAIFGGGIYGIRVLSGLYWEKEEGKESNGKCYVRRWNGKENPNTNREDYEMEDLVGDWQHDHPHERMLTHSLNYGWFPFGKLKGLEPRGIFLFYAEKDEDTQFDSAIYQMHNDLAREEKGNVGLSVVRYHAPTLTPGGEEDEEASRRINDWLERNPDKALVDIGMHYDWGAIWGKGVNGSRFVFTINWADTRDGIKDIRRPKTLKAFVTRRIGRDASAEDWNPYEDDRGFEDVIEEFEEKHPDLQVVSLKVKHQFGGFLPNGRLATRHIYLILTKDRNEDMVPSLSEATMPKAERPSEDSRNEAKEGSKRKSEYKESQSPAPAYRGAGGWMDVLGISSLMATEEELRKAYDERLKKVTLLKKMGELSDYELEKQTRKLNAALSRGMLERL